jgi:hypothetical protein
LKNFEIYKTSRDKHKMDNKTMTPTGSNEKTSMKTFNGNLSCATLKVFIITLEEKVSKLEAKKKH